VFGQAQGGVIGRRLRLAHRVLLLAGLFAVVRSAWRVN